MTMTERQQRFVLEYVKDANATQAAKRAGFSAKTARQAGTRMLSLVAVCDAVKAARGPVLLASQVTLESHLAELARLRDRALALEQTGPAVRAEECRGKAAGLYVERQMVETRELPMLRIVRE